ncbi:MAG: carbohydrate kinase family protein [Nocardioidaceae bacterium]|nr:carbohydrate kinase family protein [Nocardioidaceae bacterium]NUS49609.1 carbohydrate kinase family protein [Nocardioidaceae bacterium]
MSLLVTGSIATDHLMTFPGRFADSLVVEQLDKIALSFLVEDLEVRRGGCAANICFGLGNLGLRPVLVGAVGEDFVDYRSWLVRHNVDCESVHVSQTKHTARFVCTNDSTMAQIASFYAGAMSEAREIELEPIADRVGGVTYVLVGPNDPEGMLRHTNECRKRGYKFIADPSQQLAFGDGDMIKELVDGAHILFSNEYESALIEKKTGWSHEEILDRVGTLVVTLGAAGVRVERKGEEPIVVAAVPEIAKVEPTGVGDAFRAGFLAALEWGLSLERAAQLGCLLAVYVVEKVGTQEYTLHQAAFVRRFADAYGEDAAAEIAAHVQTPRP